MPRRAYGESQAERADGSACHPRRSSTLEVGFSECDAIVSAELGSQHQQAIVWPGELPTSRPGPLGARNARVQTAQRQVGSTSPGPSSRQSMRVRVGPFGSPEPMSRRV